MFLPENIDLAQSEKYNLSIRHTSNGFSFCIYSPSDKSVFHYQTPRISKNLSLLENIKKTFFEVNFFTQPFRKTSVINVSPHYTTIPDAYFDKKRAQNIFEFNIHKKAGKVLSNQLTHPQCHLVHDMDDDVYSFFVRTLCNPSFEHFAIHLIPFFSKYGSNSDSKRCFVDFHDEFISIWAFEKENLLSANTFPNNDPFDALYYIVHIAEKLSFNQNTDQLFLSGNLSDNEETVDTLRSLIKNTHKPEINPQIMMAENMKNETPTDILISLCES